MKSYRASLCDVKYIQVMIYWQYRSHYLLAYTARYDHLTLLLLLIYFRLPLSAKAFCISTSILNNMSYTLCLKKSIPNIFDVTWKPIIRFW